MITHILLASQSPRRREMMTWLRVPLTLTRADVDEDPRPGENPKALAIRLAQEKAQVVQSKVEDACVLAADTIVDCDQRALGKPVDAAEARVMLSHLREGMHRVHTGITLYHPATGMRLTRLVTTDVWMRPYTGEEIDAYIATGDPLDKAGAYAIQHSGFHPVQRLDRCYANVVGLPLCAVAAVMAEAGCAMTADIPALCLQHFGYHCPRTDEGIPV